MTGDGAFHRTVEIHFPVGLHVRPATIIAKKARQYKTEIFLVYQDRKVSARNVFDMFLLGAEKGAVLKLEAEEANQDDAVKALDEIASLFAPNCQEMALPAE